MEINIEQINQILEEIKYKSHKYFHECNGDDPTISKLTNNEYNKNKGMEIFADRLKQMVNSADKHN